MVKDATSGSFDFTSLLGSLRAAQDDRVQYVSGCKNAKSHDADWPWTCPDSQLIRAKKKAIVCLRQKGGMLHEAL